MTVISISTVMPGLGPGIHVFATSEDVDGRDNGVPLRKRSGVPRPSHDELN